MRRGPGPHSFCSVGLLCTSPVTGGSLLKFRATIWPERDLIPQAAHNNLIIFFLTPHSCVVRVLVHKQTLEVLIQEESRLPGTTFMPVWCGHAVSVKVTFSRLSSSHVIATLILFMLSLYHCPITWFGHISPACESSRRLRLIVRVRE